MGQRDLKRYCGKLPGIISQCRTRQGRGGGGGVEDTAAESGRSGTWRGDLDLGARRLRWTEGEGGFSDGRDAARPNARAVEDPRTGEEREGRRIAGPSGALGGGEDASWRGPGFRRLLRVLETQDSGAGSPGQAPGGRVAGLNRDLSDRFGGKRRGMEGPQPASAPLLHLPRLGRPGSPTRRPPLVGGPARAQV